MTTNGMTAPVTDRLPPHSVEAEQAVLGGVLLDPDACMGECIERLGVNPQVFYDVRHQAIYQTLLQMHEQRTAIDPITLYVRLRGSPALEECGGLEYLSGLPNKTPSAANLKYHLDIVQDKFAARRVIQVCQEAQEQAFQTKEGVGPLLDTLERRIMAIRSPLKIESYSSMTEVLPLAMNQIETACNAGGKPLGIGTGLVDLDRATSGLKPGEVIIVAARPGMGKTSLGMQIAEHAAVVGSLPVGVFSLEMTRESLVTRMLCSMARVDIHSVALCALGRRTLAAAHSKLSKAALFIDDASGITIAELRARAHRMAHEHGIKLLIVDYLQLLRAVTSGGKRMDNRQLEVAEISSGLKNLAKELHIPVVALSQLNREVETRTNKRPVLSDLRESGAIEQDADQVWLLYLVQNDGPPAKNGAIQTKLWIAKQRNGPTGEVNLIFLPQFTRFETTAKISDEDVP